MAYTVISSSVKELAKICVEISRWLFCTEHVPVEHYLIILLHPTFVSEMSTYSSACNLSFC
ncbi:hypothetical protein T4D_8236 [Trichinella pseudospiralis]|uniref:Uncharacterized protein n=1 Tax=Trichinella pseudospiralis TaxID=6337 RepID=A0A0V1FDQ1_TRIPS|nr:hypothetical protein T4D_8236 [Trichinella pseudospiralis]